MKFYCEKSLCDFEPWSGAVCRFKELTSDECEQLESILEDLYPDGMDETTLNDLLWFEEDWIAEQLGYKDWEHLERDHKGECTEEHALEVLHDKYPGASDGLKELFDQFVENEWSNDMTDEEIIENFEEYREENDPEEEEDEE